MSNSVRNLYKLYVGNIPWTVSHNELRKYFSKFGHVQSAAVIFDKETGLSRSYGFVSFSKRESLENACSKNHHQLEGQLLKVQPSGSDENP